LEEEKCAVFGWQGDLINRLIHRSWGETFVNIFLDLSNYISHFSSSTVVCALGGTIQGPLCKAASPIGYDAGDEVRMEMDDRTSDVSPWDVSQWTVMAIILRPR
jgi:hypothetical protein